MDEWYYEKNCGFGPEDFSYGSHVAAWWRCSAGPDHVYQMRILKRGTRGDGCPFCRGYRASPTNSLAMKFPEIAREWHPTRNKKMTPDQVVAGSTAEYWWRCAQGHCWQAQVNNRTALASACPRCSLKERKRFNTELNKGLRPLSKFSVATQFPHLRKEWHPTKNGELTPDMVRKSNRSTVWWQCSAFPEHEWQAKISWRTRKMRPGCPLCARSM